jgi:uncharacterized membrane protein
VFSSGWPGWLLALLVICAGAGLWWHMRQNHGRLEGRRPWAIWGLQFATAALILLLLWQPAIGIRSLRSQQNVVAVLLDTSRSMALGEGETSRLDQARQALAGGVLEQLQQKFRVRLYSFSGQLDRLASLDQVPPPGNATRIGDAVAGVLRESAALPLGAVVVVSDGSDNSGGFDRKVLAEIRQSNVPVHTVGVGRTELPEDTELSDVVVAPRALPNSRLNAQLTIRHNAAEQKETRITVRDGSRILASKPITLRRGEPVQIEFVDFSAGEPGIRNLLFVLDPLPGEKIAGNNSLTRVVDVPRKRRRILYVEGEPRWEYKFIHRAVEHDPSVQLVTMLRTSPNKFYRQGVDHVDELADGFPVKPEELFAFDALILGSIEAAYFTPEQQDMIKEFVNRRGGTLLLLGGRHGLADGGWGTSKVAEVLPVALSTGDATTFVREKAPVELTVQGADSLICRFDDDPEKNAKLWKEMPDLADYQRVGELKPAAVELLGFKLGGETQPLLVLQNYGRGRAMILASGGTWRWKMGLPHDDTRHYTFWQQLLRSLVANSPGTVTISSDQTLYADRSDVTLRAEVRTKEYQPANNATVTAVVTPETGAPLTLELSPSAEEPGVYESNLTAAAPGAYRVEVSAFVGDQSLGSEAFHFRRQDGVAEDFRPAQNRELLTKLAEQTGGRYWTLDDLAGLPEEIRFSEAGVTAREIMDLWDMPFFFLLLLSLRAGEWLLRRRWGVV